MQKSYNVKIYNFGGTYLKTINPDLIISQVSFANKINQGQGQLNIDVALPIDDFDEGSSINHMNIVKVFEIDDVNSPEARLIYTGFISQYIPIFTENKEYVRLVCLGLVSLLSLAYFKNGAGFTVVKSARDPGLIMKDIIDHFNLIFTGSWLSYSSGGVVNVGTNVSYSFVDLKWFDSLKKTFELAGGNRWWYIDQFGQLYFQQKPSAATHRFAIGRDVQSGEVKKNNEKIYNSIQLRWGSPVTNTNYSDATSVADYQTREKIITDSQIANLTTANQRGNQEIADNKDPKVEAKIKINTQYDIESIRPGDTCSVYNVNGRTTLFPDNMLITSVTYNPDGVDLELESLKATFAEEFKKAVQNIQ